MTRARNSGTDAPAARRWVAALAAGAAAVALSVATSAVSSPVAADTAPAAGVPRTVSADGLPTWQINGVVWSQAIVGNTVYVAGNFTKARPAGVAPGGAGEVSAPYAFAYDITTGNRVASFNPVLDAQANVVTASPDGKTVYLGGDFSTVNGVARAHIAAFSTATNALVGSFAPTVAARVAAIAVSSTTVYAGGDFTSVNATSRSYLAAFNPSNGALLPWAPKADLSVLTMVMAPGGSRVIAGGRFTTLNGNAAYGMGSLDATTAASLPWAAQDKLRDAGANGGITSLRSDGTNILGGGYAFGSGSAWEGVFAANPTTGAIVYANDCHGDTYDVFPMGQVVYQASHVHTCEWIGSYKNTQPFANRFGTAYTNYATTTNTGPDDYGWNFAGLPAGAVLDWFPTITPGTFTGQNQAAWSLTGNSTYVAYGGEFTHVNGVAQQGLVRFALPTAAPNKVAPTFSSLLVPGVQSLASGSVRVTWPAGVDRDNATLTYRLFRDGGTTPIYTTTVDSTFWNVPGLSYIDSGLAPGSTHTYYVRVTDPFNNAQNGPSSAPVTVASGGPNAYVTAVLGDGATHYWRLDEATGTQLVDWAGTTPLYAGTTVTRGAAGAINGDADTAVSVDGTATGMAAQMYGQLLDAPSVFSVEAWIRTTSTSGGEIVGFGNLTAGNSGINDRRLYMTNNGKVVFGMSDPNRKKVTISSPASYNNGAYHHIVGTFSSAGMALYVDGARVASTTSITQGRAYQGYWRLGQDSMSGWSPQPASSAFVGTIDDVAVYGGALTTTQVARHYTAATTAPTNQAPTARISAPACNAGACSFDGTTSSDPDGTIASYAWTFGDGSTATGATPAHTYAASGTYTVTLVVTDNLGVASAPAALSLPVTVPVANQAPTARISAPSCTAGACSFDGSTSSDPDGTIASYAWTFGDGSTGTGSKPSHTYAASGTYTVTLVVTDNQSATSPAATASVTVTVPAPNQAPTARISAPSCSAGACSFDGSTSSDPDGTIASYAWTFGDGGTATGGKPSHTYATSGTFTVSLVVTDNQGATSAAATTPVTVTVATTNQAPVARMAAPTCVSLVCGFDGSTSSDPDGSITSYAWTFGDGGTATGAKPSHTYAAGGTFTVTLVVTDNQGATGTTSTTVSPVTAFALDTFSRTVSGGWGTAETGGAWTTSPTSVFAVTGTAGTLTLAAPSAGPSAYLAAVSRSSSDTYVTVTTDKAATGGGIYANVIGRRIVGQGDYRVKVRLQSTGAVGVTLTYVNGAGAETTLKAETTVAGLTYTAGTRLRIRLQVTGTSPTTVQAKVWLATGVEPAGWTATVTDATAAMQAAGGLGVAAYLSGSATNAPVVETWDDLRSGPVG
jgi:PKD repeat protein